MSEPHDDDLTKREHHDREGNLDPSVDRGERWDWPGDARIGITTQERHHIAIQTVCTVNMNNKRWRDHARLIAAAPELLVALEKSVGDLEWAAHYHMSDDLDAIVNRVHAAIAKARGSKETT